MIKDDICLGCYLNYHTCTCWYLYDNTQKEKTTKPKLIYIREIYIFN